VIVTEQNVAWPYTSLIHKYFSCILIFCSMHVAIRKNTHSNYWFNQSLWTWFQREWNTPNASDWTITVSARVHVNQCHYVTIMLVIQWVLSKAMDKHHAPSFLFFSRMGCIVRLYTSHDWRGVITETNHVEWNSYCGIVWYWNSFYWIRYMITDYWWHMYLTPHNERSSYFIP